MSRKIIGVTVGTTISPASLERKLKPVKTVNGVSADENGNVEIELNSESVTYSPQILSEEQKAQARANIGAATVDDVLAALPTWEGGSY